MKNHPLLKSKRQIQLFFCLLFVFTTAGQLFSQVVINEYSVSNLSTIVDNYNKYEDWIELRNTSSTSVNLSGYYLSDNPNKPTKWQFPDGVILAANAFMKVWASGRNEVSGGHYHTSFKLSQTKDEKEFIVLSDPDGNIIEQIQLQLTQKGHSRGKAAFGAENWVIFTTPTPGAANISSGSYNSYSAKPEMSMPAGFYLGTIDVELSTTEPDAQIRYTLDGSEPTATSTLYVNPITLTQTKIINARTFSNSPAVFPGLINFNTYFINVTHTMPVISASAAQLDDLLNGNQSLMPFGTFEYFNKNNVRTTFGYGEFNEHGQDSWVHPQRSIDYITRDECGYNYAIRDTIIPLTDRNEFQRIILRAAGDDNYPGIDSSALLRDLLVQNTATRNGMHLDTRKGEKCVMYVNGQFWGVYGMREKVSDHDFTDYYYGQDKYHLYYLQLWGSSWAEYGGQDAWDDWNELHDFIKANSMANQANFDYVKTRLDYTSLADYIIINSFVVCSDWINWNVGWWRGTNPDGGHQKWGYVLWDEDATFNHYINYTGVPSTLPTVSPCFPQGLSSDPEEHIVLLNRLLTNPEFKQYYINRYIDLYNTAFRPDNIITYLNTIADKMAPEMPRHVARWGGTVARWETNVQKIRNFINTRYAYLPQGLKTCYNLTGPFNVSVEAQPIGSGNIQLNSLELTEFPWQGTYFGGVGIKLKAIPADISLEFDYWELSNHAAIPNINSSEITLNLSNWENAIAHFKPKIYTDSLIINEINYNPADNFNTGDWVELYNPHPYELNISGWVFKDEDDTHAFVFPEGSSIEANGYVVICNSLTDFSALFPDVTNIVGDMGFGLSGSGELIRLYDNNSTLIDHVTYDDKAPWPVEPDGSGPTLELIKPEFDNALPESWMASPGHGTPGAMNSQLVVLPQHTAMQPQSLKMNIFPNPMNQSASISFNNQNLVLKGKLEMFNMWGTIVRTYDNLNSNFLTIQKDNLTSGVYTLIYIDDIGNHAQGKMIVQ